MTPADERGNRAPGAVAHRRPRAFQRIVAAIREDVFRRRLSPGDRLAHEAALAERFQVSRLAVREALRVLELQGIVRVEHGFQGGAYVTEGGSGPVTNALETMLRLEHLERGEIYTARRYLEPEIAALAAHALDEGSVAALRENVAEGERRLAAGRSAFTTNVDFHAGLAGSCGNRILTLMSDALLELLRAVESRRPSDGLVNREACAAHRAILDAVVRRDADLARALMARHLEWLEHHFAGTREPRQR